MFIYSFFPLIIKNVLVKKIVLAFHRGTVSRGDWSMKAGKHQS